ncbi:MAG: YbhB/YbcL family Raf kinase inhibitor-like protein [Myxococcota bacterium]
MNLSSTSFVPHGMLDSRFALGRHHAETHFEFSDNRNPQLTWDSVPAGTRSLALLCVDSDVPTVADNVNKEGRTVDVWLPRGDFYHWVLVDLPPDLRSIAEGVYSDGVTPKGKSFEKATPLGGRSGLNHYTYWFEGNADMGGDWHGYDGPGPPWNDERMHAYKFQLFALDVPRLDLPPRFFGADVRSSMKDHILGRAELIARYAINPSVAAQG